MSKILEEYIMRLVPSLPATGYHKLLPNHSVIEFDDTHFFKILFGGGYLTAARTWGTQALRATEDKATD